MTDPVAHHGEGPVWSPRWGGLRWVDMLAGDVLSLAEDGTVGRRHVADVVAALRPRRHGAPGARGGDRLQRTGVEPGRLPCLLRRHPHAPGRRLRLLPRHGADRT